MSTALYRRYRPETFADVIGQEHVTEPLMAAIDKDRINHAYLFSGPRGCGKTTSARILARCLNCAQGPTSTPCGTCDSCVELARNGSGSLDVIEIDAASHGGVDDARDLRERATFAPVRDRFKIFIIDEAHMVTSAGFNALLKIVEEPPEHILFIFATTEPDKVIGTIRSRTHHYPFRLVPPEPLLAYLEQLCHQENVPVAPGVLSLVIRAGGGSVRDSLSVLDQLMAGASESGLDYELAVSLLGYTHATLLDDVVDSVAAGDAGTVFNAVDRVIQTGHDPRRFVEDLLERFRDLIVINAVPEGAASILRGVPDDQLNRMRTQANQLGAGELSRAADVTNTALTEMTGATSPRLHLELLCARLLLPAADATARGTLARVDRIERRLEYAAGAPTAESPEVDEAPKAPARPRLEGVPRTAEEAAARWSLPAMDTGAAAAAAPAAVPGAHTPAVPAASRIQPARPAVEDPSPDWGGSWGVSTDTAFADPAPAQQPAAAGPARTPGQPHPSAGQDAGAPAPSTGTHDPAGPDVETGRRDPTQPAVNEQPAAAAPAGTHPTQQPADSAPAGPQSTQQSAAAAPPATRPTQPGPATGEQHTMPRQGQPGADRGQQDGAAGPQQPPAAGGRQPAGPAQQRPTPSADQPQEARRAQPPQQGQPAASGGNVEMVRRAWPEIMDEVARIKRATWLIVNVSAKPRSFEGNQLVLAFANQGNAIGFQRGPHMDNLKQAIHKVLGLTCSIEAVHDAGGSGESGPKVPSSQAAPASNPGRGPATPSPDRSQGPTTTAGGSQDVHHDGGSTGSTPPQAPAAPAVSVPPAASAPTRPAGPDAPTASVPVGVTVAEGGPARTGPAGAVGMPGGPAAPATASAPAPAPAPAVSGTSDTGARRTSDSSSGHSRTGSAAPESPPRAPAQAPVRRPDGPATPAATGGQAPVRRPDGPATPAATGGARGARDDRTETEPEATSAWDPSMSDDSWALVEPPEEAFDPGPDWGSVPEDPSERRSPLPNGQGPARPGGPAEPARTGSTRTRGSATPAPAQPGASGGAASGPVPTPERPTADRAPAAAASRSVVWSPSVESNPPAGGSTTTRPTGDPEATGGAPTSLEGPGAAGRATGVARPGGIAAVPSFIGTAAAAGTSATASGHTAPSAVGAAPAGTTGAAVAPDRPASADNIRQKPVSRYQQLLDEAERKRAEEAAATRGAADLRFVDDEPSADDETIEESGLVGRTAIERILNGRLIEERGVDGQ
ncbi:DNA polymerase III subunit gamma and tau [Arthrobacter sp. MDT1-48-3]